LTLGLYKLKTKHKKMENKAQGTDKAESEDALEKLKEILRCLENSKFSLKYESQVPEIKF